MNDKKPATDRKRTQTQNQKPGGPRPSQIIQDFKEMLSGLPSKRAEAYLSGDGPRALSRHLRGKELVERIIKECQTELKGESDGTP